MLMSRQWSQIAIPIAQVLLLLATALWYNMAKYESGSDWTIAAYAVMPIDIVAKLNFPLLILWCPIIVFLGWIVFDSYVQSPSGTTLVALSVVFALLLLISVALFWYSAGQQPDSDACAAKRRRQLRGNISQQRPTGHSLMHPNQHHCL